MKILIVALYDDNLGDMLIRVCFRQLLRVALQDSGITEDSCELLQMDLETQDEELMRSSDAIFFAGGGLFGLSYLGFAPYVEKILELADKEKIPVIMSSLGINNMDASLEDEERLRELLSHDCIRALSVRENEELFRKFAPENKYPVETVCDPVVWAQDVFNMERGVRQKPIIGINAVRGGLFRDNGYEWHLVDELSYIKEMADVLEEHGLDYRIYTNGSFLDNNTLSQLKDIFEISEEKILRVRTSEELVNTVASFSAVLSIRMHSSILSYAFGIPALNLIWNDKIPLFYENINKPERAIALEDWSAPALYERISELVSLREEPDEEYKMSLFRFISRSLSELADDEVRDDFDYGWVSGKLRSMAEDAVDDSELFDGENDVKYYIRRAERSYSSLFEKDRAKTGTIDRLKNKLAESRQEHRDDVRELKELKKEQKKFEQREEKLNKKIERRNAKIERLQNEIEELNKMPAVRATKKIKRILAK